MAGYVRIGADGVDAEKIVKTIRTRAAQRVDAVLALLRACDQIVDGVGDAVHDVSAQLHGLAKRHFNARADLLVFPSLYDNAPMVVREAAAAGTPALLIRGSCAAEGVADGENGYLVEDTPEAIAAGMARAIETGETVGANARQTIPLAWDAVIAKARARYEVLAERYRTGELSRKSDWFYELADRAEEWLKV